MDKAKTDKLFKAAKAGDVATLRALLADGVPVDCQDHERMTPLMRAAQSGQAQAFQALVDAGADLNAVGMSHTNVIQKAAEGGNVEIVRFLLDKGVPIEGHWQPRSQAARRMGHMTPLICAAIEGHVEVVRLLLESGADRDAKYDGQTALKMVQEEIKFPTFSDSAESKQKYREVADALAVKPSGSSSVAESAAKEAASFSNNAQVPAYLRVRQLIQDRCGKSRPWKPQPDHGSTVSDVLAFTLRDCRDEKELTGMVQEAQKAGCHLILSEPWAPGERAELVLFPTADKFAVVLAMGTEGGNYGVQTADVMDWLSDLDKENTFALRYCSHELVGGEFLKSVKQVKKLAERIVEFCPSILDEAFESREELALSLKQNKSFLLRWD